MFTKLKLILGIVILFSCGTEASVKDTQDVKENSAGLQSAELPPDSSTGIITAVTSMLVLFAVIVRSVQHCHDAYKEGKKERAVSPTDKSKLLSDTNSAGGGALGNNQHSSVLIGSKVTVSNDCYLTSSISNANTENNVVDTSETRYNPPTNFAVNSQSSDNQRQ
jgi:hypothetical protein